MAVVFEVRHAETGEAHALKLLNASLTEADVQRRFQREFRTLARLHHPNICRVEDWGTWAGRPYFVMELLVGHDLKTEVETWEPLEPEARWARVRGVLVQVARALEYVHRRGLVHRDVTPGNIMVAPDGSAKLTDFGVAKEADTTEMTAHGELLGTVAYVAPEQISGGAVDARADLYSLGAVLYLMLTGRRPFQARTLAGFIDKHLNRPPRPPRELVPGVPPLLEEICLRLLQKDPGRRFASATHLLQVLEGGAGAALSLDPREWPAVLVGRDEEIARVEREVRLRGEAGAGGAVVWINGPVGHGKTRLLQHAVDLAERLGLRTITSRAEAGGAPLLPFVPLLDAVREAGIPVPRSVDRLFGNDPETSRTYVDRLGAYSALRDCLPALCPLVVVVDDMHLADPHTVELAEYLVRNTVGLVQERILWAFASTPGVQDGLLEGISRGAATETVPAILQLRPLTPAAAEQLLLTLLPDDPATPALARRIFEDAEGNPAHFGEIVRGLVEQRVIELGALDGSARLHLATADLSRLPLPIPQSVRDAFARRVAALGPHARRVAEVLAVARQELGIAMLADIVGMGDNELLRAVDELIDAGLARERRVQADAHFDLAHLRLREFLYQDIPTPTRTILHRRVGETLERACRRQLHVVIEAVAWHFEQGEVPGKAYPYLIRAGQRLLDRSFALEAETFFDRAVAIEPDAREHITLDEADRLLADVLLKRAEALDYLGRHEEIDAILDRAGALARELGDDRLLARAMSALAQQSRRHGDADAAEQRHRDALELATRAGDHVRRAAELYALGTLRWGRGDLEGARENWIESLAIGEATRDERAVGYGYAGLGFVALSKGQTADGRKHFEQALDVFDRLGLVNAAVITRCNLVELHHFAGNLRRGRELAERAVSQAREAGSPSALVHGRRNLSLVLVDLGYAQQAFTEAEAALTLVRRLGQPAETLATLRCAIRAAWALGDHGALRPMLDEALQGAERHDNEGALGVIRCWRARLCAESGDPVGAFEEIRLAQDVPASPWPYQECRMDLVLARTYARLGDLAEATRRAEAAIRRADAAGFRLYALKGHALAARYGADEAAVARHKRVASGLARSLAANLPPADAERFLAADGLSALG